MQEKSIFNYRLSQKHKDAKLHKTKYKPRDFTDSHKIFHRRDTKIRERKIESIKTNIYPRMNTNLHEYSRKTIIME